MPPGGPVTSDSDIESVLSLQIEKPKVRRNSVGPKYYCSIEGCNEYFKRLDHLDRHEYKHTGIVSFSTIVELFSILNKILYNFTEKTCLPL